ncbi:hypothetical protein FUAX_13890 [Fulvitalea axinellae]|uniref:NadR/Ttd14 AAA domain-containing protein n=1 Tax=Fulvitalea axinellae TaxID=1182444 RepID=A0AAU9CPU4_9BACT|nr:hypothetical protein FUAX_13890 [Fulvitalea axinellae]
MATEKVKRILISGPESTGKSTLCKALAQKYGTLWVPEYARAYCEALDRPYEESDLLPIAKGQWESENELAQQAKDYIFCDTGLEVIKVWGDYKYGRVDSWVLDRINPEHYDLVLLTDIDIEWEYDPLREYPDMKDRIFFRDYYLRELKALYGGCHLISGSLENRIQTVSLLLEALG